LLSNNYRINFRGLEDHENHENLYTTKISTLTVPYFTAQDAIYIYIYI